MKGVALSSLSRELSKVAVAHAKNPAASLEFPDDRFGVLKNYLVAYRNDPDLEKGFDELPMKAARVFTFDEICKLRYSSGCGGGSGITSLFESDPQYEVIRKIINSMWRWGMNRPEWNEIVDAYNGVRHFSFLNHPDFELRLDYSTGYNECGYSKFSRTFLDGVFGLLVYYKRKHVLTIGFSFMEGRQILLQQVQLAERTGNRWLYKVPANRLEFVLKEFVAQFPEHDVHLIDGTVLVKKTLASYRDALRRKGIRIEGHRSELAANFNPQSRTWIEDCLAEDEQDYKTLEEKIAHLEADRKRLVAFYSNAGMFTLSSSITVNGLPHRHVSPSTAKTNESVAA